MKREGVHAWCYGVPIVILGSGHGAHRRTPPHHVQGFEGFLTSKNAAAKNKNKIFRLEDRAMSLSSTTSPAVRSRRWHRGAGWDFLQRGIAHQCHRVAQQRYSRLPDAQAPDPLACLPCATVVASACHHFPGQTQELIAEQEQARQDALGFGRNSAMGYPPPGYGKGRRG